MDNFNLRPTVRSLSVRRFSDEEPTLRLQRQKSPANHRSHVLLLFSFSFEIRNYTHKITYTHLHTPKLIKSQKEKIVEREKNYIKGRKQKLQQKFKRSLEKLKQKSGAKKLWRKYLENKT